MATAQICPEKQRRGTAREITLEMYDVFKGNGDHSPPLPPHMFRCQEYVFSLPNRKNISQILNLGVPGVLNPNTQPQNRYYCPICMSKIRAGPARTSRYG